MFILPSPVQFLYRQKSIEVYVKRDDLIHPVVSGNKWRKLKGIVDHAVRSGKNGLLTFGGAFSNHVLATAAAGTYFDLPTVAIIRGENNSKTNPTLSEAASYGMSLHFVDRKAYKEKESSPIVQSILSQYENYEMISEGGKHPLALLGVSEIIQECIDEQYGNIDFLVTAIGTGTTYAGLLQSIPTHIKLVGIPVLKHKNISEDICSFIGISSLPENAKIVHDYHFGGYAKFTNEQVLFMKQLKQNYQLDTDVVYTSKVFYAVQDLIRSAYFPEHSKVLVLHTGGLQGNRGMEIRFPEIFKL